MQYSEYRNIHGKCRKRVGRILSVGKPQVLRGVLLNEKFNSDLLIEGVLENVMSYFSNLKLNLKSQL